MIQFDLDGYKKLLDLVAENYKIITLEKVIPFINDQADFENYSIIRHDVDYCLTDAYHLAKLENSLGIKSTYYILSDSIYYNPSSQQSRYELLKIVELGHDVGLHFDVAQYPVESHHKTIAAQKKYIENICQQEICSVSYHNPAVIGLENLDLSAYVGGLFNTYSLDLKKSFSYFSDSLCRFRNQALLQEIKQKIYCNLHILIHPIWWVEEGANREDKIKTVYHHCCSGAVFWRSLFSAARKSY